MSDSLQAASALVESEVATSSVASVALKITDFTTITLEKLVAIKKLVKELQEKANIARRNVSRVSYAIMFNKPIVTIPKKKVVTMPQQSKVNIDKIMLHAAKIHFVRVSMILQSKKLASLKAAAILAAAETVYLWQNLTSVELSGSQLSELIALAINTKDKIQQVQIAQADTEFLREKAEEIKFWEIQQCIWEARIQNLLMNKLAITGIATTEQPLYVNALQATYNAVKLVVEKLSSARNEVFILVGANSQEWQQSLRFWQQQVETIEQQLRLVGVDPKVVAVPIASSSVAAAPVASEVLEVAAAPVAASYKGKAPITQTAVVRVSAAQQEIKLLKQQLLAKIIACQKALDEYAQGVAKRQNGWPSIIIRGFGVNHAAEEFRENLATILQKFNAFDDNVTKQELQSLQASLKFELMFVINTTQPQFYVPLWKSTFKKQIKELFEQLFGTLMLPTPKKP